MCLQLIGQEANVSGSTSSFGPFVEGCLGQPPIQTPELTLAKTAGETSYDEVGGVLHYSYEVTNTGNVSLAGPVTVADDKATVTCPAVSSVGDLDGFLDPGETVVCAATYTVTQADLDAGSVVNTATAHAGGTDSNQAQATVPAVQTPSLSLLKSITSGDPYAAVGATIQYGYVVTNTGNVTVHGLAVADDNVGAAPICDKVVLAPNETATCTASHTVTQADLDAGTVVNNASASGLDPGNAAVTSNTDSETAHATQTPAVTIVKSSNATPATKAGDVVTFSFVVTNTGNVTITSFVVTDPLPGMSAINCGGVTSLAPMTATTCTATYTVTQADVDAGVIRNTATVNGQTPAGAVARRRHARRRRCSKTPARDARQELERERGDQRPATSSPSTSSSRTRATSRSRRSS